MTLKDKILSVLVLLLTAWALLYKLTDQPMYLWDESRQANNALEMANSGNYLFSTYLNEPDFWNTKPHLLIIIQAVFIKFLGPGLLALRLPSALAGIGTVWLWFRFFQKRIHTRAGILFVFILLCSGSFNSYHITRTGDYDSLLLLFFSFSFLSFTELLSDGFNTIKVAGFWIFFSLGILTKSLAALLWIPGFIAAWLLTDPDKKKHFSAILRYAWIPLLVILAYYGYREWSNPGYVQAVWENEIMTRYFAPNEGHETTFAYYFQELGNHAFQWLWIFAVLFGIFGFIWKNRFQKIITIQVIFVLVFLLVISFSGTRIHWYMAPAIPLLAAMIATGSGIWEEFTQVKNRFRFVIPILYLLIIASGIVNWQENWKKNTGWEGVQPQVALREIELRGKSAYTGIWLLSTYNPIEEYYRKVFAKKQIPFRTSQSFHFQKGDTVIIHHYEQIDSINRFSHHLQLHAPDKEYPVWVMKIDSVYQK